MNGSNWELVDVDGSDGQVVALWPESVFIGGPGQSEFLAFGGDPVRGSSVGVAINVVVSGFAIRIVGDALHLLLHLRFLTGRVVRSRVAAKLTKLIFIIICLNSFKENKDLPPFAASVKIADVVLAGDGDSAMSAVLVVAGRTVAGRCHVTGVSVG